MPDCAALRASLAAQQSMLSYYEAIDAAAASVAVASQAVADAYKIVATNAHNTLLTAQGDIDLLEEQIAAECDETGTGSGSGF